ncbi:helix-turn-helix domain-containing protein [Micromonospora echinospora]|uniref:helix-turn-helix domain-containing protein n=1 Tax=Micromonospora echinospora TaxID=1877 RepID=UPI0020132C3A|nr:helix-turn-helix domain-containing protein [Micromonospora echinospora]
MDGRYSSGLRFPGLITGQQVAEARRDLGRRLAAWRAERGLTQMQLAKSICYSRSSVANAEIGRDTSVRRFWQDADRAVDARGALLAAFDQMAALVRDFHTQRAQARDEERQRRAGRTAIRATQAATGDCGCGMVVVGRWTGQETRALREALRMTVHDFARHLEVEPATVSGWEHRHTSTPPPAMATQAALDETLTLADSNAIARFLLILDTPDHHM